MRLSSLGIRGKLNVLLLLPLTAVLLVTVPFVAGQIEDARSAGRTEDLAGRARDFSDLVWELQRERLLTATFLATATGDNSELVRQHRAVDLAATNAMDTLGTLDDDESDELASALVRIGSLRELRQNTLRRGVAPDVVARTYHAVIGAILDALRLAPQRTSDAEGTRQLTVLDALLRANEENELRGMALIATAVNPTTGQLVLDNASDQSRMLTERFVQQADVEHATLVVEVDQGAVARKIDALAARLPLANVRERESFAIEASARVQEHSRLRRTAQDAVTSQVTAAAASRAGEARWLAWLFGIGAALMFGLVGYLALRISRSISDPLRRLTDAATTVADLAETELVRVADTEGPERQAPRLAEIDVHSGDEIGTLAAAFNRVQSTASMLVERQAVTRRNVSLMFANVAQRTQNLVGRQLALVDELERDEQDVKLLERLYRLDHVSTRLRRSADNLLVVAGAQDRGRLTGPIELATALRSALAEIEDYKRVHLGAIADVTLSPQVGADLVLVFAELMENATSFSPPDSRVEVDTKMRGDGACVIKIVDHGIGLPPQKLHDENRRLVERERLDVVPTTVLGLFVVGRLARRHRLRVELHETRGGGVTAQITLGPMLFSVREVEPEPEPPSLLIPLIPEFRIPSAAHTEGFDWFPGFAEAAPVEAPVERPVRAALPPRRPATPPPSRGGLTRRIVGAQLPGSAAPKPPSQAPVGPRDRDPKATRDALDDFNTAFALATPAVEVRGGLSRRVPGAHLAPGLRAQEPTPATAEAKTSTDWRMRDPEHERAAFDTFTTGLARADRATGPVARERADGADPRRESRQ